MTIEKAINDLKDFIDIYLTCHGEEDTVAVSLNNVDVEAFHMAIKALQEPRWIPVSEKLPENKTYVLTIIKVPNRIAHTRSGWYEGGFFHNDNGDVWRATDNKVIAWMPLPEPYKEESESEE